MKLARALRLAALGSALVAGAFVFYRTSRDRRDNPEAAVPRDSFVVATVDVERLRRSSLAKVLFGDEKAPKDSGTARALGLGNLARACGFDPISRVQTMVVSVPEEEDPGEFGVAAKITVTPDELEACTKGLAREHEGKAETHRQGSFAIVSDKGGRRIGYGDGGLLLVGKGGWFDRMLATVEKKSPSLGAAAEHVAVRAALTRGDGWAAPAVLLSAVLPRALRERLKGEMGGPEGDRSAAVMTGVLGVTTAGLAMRAGGAADSVDLRAELACESADACAAVAKLLQKTKLDLSKDLSIRIMGLGALIDSIEVTHDGARVHASASMNGEALASSLARVLRVRRPGFALDEPDDAAEPRPRDPDGGALGLGERVAAPRDGGHPVEAGAPKVKHDH